MEDALGLPTGVTDVSRRVLAGHGNMSSPTVLFILERAAQGEGPAAVCGPRVRARAGGRGGPVPLSRLRAEPAGPAERLNCARLGAAHARVGSLTVMNRHMSLAANDFVGFQPLHFTWQPYCNETHSLRNQFANNSISSKAGPDRSRRRQTGSAGAGRRSSTRPPGRSR